VQILIFLLSQCLLSGPRVKGHLSWTQWCCRKYYPTKISCSKPVLMMLFLSMIFPKFLHKYLQNRLLFYSQEKRLSCIWQCHFLLRNLQVFGGKSCLSPNHVTRNLPLIKRRIFRGSQWQLQLHKTVGLQSSCCRLNRKLVPTGQPLPIGIYLGGKFKS
jgi:hypothetical protein